MRTYLITVFIANWHTISTLGFTLQRSVSNRGGLLDTILDEDNITCLGIAVHVCLGSIYICLCGCHKIFGVIIHKEIADGDKHTICLEELAQILACSITHLLGNMQIVVLTVALVSALNVNHSVSITIGCQRVVPGTFVDRILAQQRKELGVEIGVTPRSMIVKIQLIIESGLCPRSTLNP